MTELPEPPVILDDIDTWHEVEIPGSDRPVTLHSLRRDPESGASLSVVRFPPGWRRPSTGHYTCAEEFMILDGGIQVGTELTSGDYVYLPPRTPRANTFCASGALVVAWFSASVAWVEGDAVEPPPGSPVVSRGHGMLRSNAAEVTGAYHVWDEQAGWPLSAPADVLDPESARWQWVPAGSRGTLAAPRLHVRTWA